MSKSRGKTRWSLIYILIFATILSYAGFKYFTRPTPQPINIMVIEPAPLTYGETTIFGGLHKDVDGNFVLVLPDRRVVALDVQGISQLDGYPVSVSGILTPAPNSTQPMSMLVKKITVVQ